MAEIGEAFKTACIHCGEIVSEEETMGFWTVGEVYGQGRHCDAAPDHLHEVAAWIYALDDSDPADNCEGQDECTARACEHAERGTGLWAHCGVPGCSNYVGICPDHSPEH